MRNKFHIIVSLVFLIFFISGCTQQPKEVSKEKPTEKNATEEKPPEVPSETPPVKKEEPKNENESATGNGKLETDIIGPNGCSGVEKCTSYCLANVFDCKAWCELNNENKAVCDKYGIKITMPSGIPDSPCAKDDDCQSGLICLDYKCAPPTPANMAKKSDFKMPGGCTTMQECASYCAKPENSKVCTSFCENFPSFCGDLSKLKAANAPEECKECVKCEETAEPKDCILDCTYTCYAYMPFEKQNVEELKKDVTFERKYQTPIKAVWEPGPANNRNGIMYFIDYYKELGINTYSITPKYNHKDGKLIHVADYVIGEEAADNEKIANIIRAKKAGLQVVLVAHDLYDMFPDVSGKDPNLNPAMYYDDIEKTALKWAQVAEDYKVEYFVPVNEFEYVLYENGYSAEESCRITNGLYKQIIPKVREVYKGKIYCRVGGMDAKFSCMDFSQCDMFGFTYGFSGGDPKSNFDAAFTVGEEVAARDGKPYIMAEAFSFNWQGYSACANLHLAGIESYKANAKNGAGYTFMGVVQRDPINKNDCPIVHPEVKGTLVPAYKEFFKWMDQNS